MSETPLSVLHTGECARLDKSAYIRSTFGKSVFPITSLVHGLSYQESLWRDFGHLLFTPVLPCDSIICTSPAARDAVRNVLSRIRENIEALGGRTLPQEPRLDVIPLGIDTNFYRPHDKRTARHVLGLPENATVLLYFGRIDHVSKADLSPLLFAFKRLVSEHGERVFLVIAGNDVSGRIEHFAQIAEELGRRHQVIFRAHPTASEGPLYYSAADIFVSPVDTLQESFGLSPVEAMACGLPAVVADWSGFRDTVVHGETGFLVKTRWMAQDDHIASSSPLRPWEEDHLEMSQALSIDVGELTHYLSLLVANSALRAEMGRCARKRALAIFAWPEVIRRVSALWQELDAIAKTIPPSQLVRQTIERSEYVRDFGHYASQVLTGDELVMLTDRGMRACKEHAMISPPPGMENRLKRDVLLLILTLTKASSLFKAYPPLRLICERAGRQHGLSSSQAVAHGMWLLKYDLLAVAEGSRDK